MSQPERSSSPAAWRQQLRNRLPLYGHRNWIVVTDAAYPVHANPGIETIVTGADGLEALRMVLEEVAACPHLRPNVYTDLELNAVAESDAPGIGVYRNQLRACLNGVWAQSLKHDEIIARLDASADRFQVLVLKTNLALPYTSVFLELDCGYWNAAAEQRLRESMRQ